MALIPPFFLDAVVSIGIPTYNNEILWIGSGFIVGHQVGEYDEQKRYHIFLITNKHVLVNNNQIIVRFVRADKSGIKDYPIILNNQLGSIWSGHPSPSIDIAVFQIDHNSLSLDGASGSFFSLTDHSVGISQMKEMEFSEGDGIFVLGFPMGIISSQQLYVIAKSGCIARIRDVLKEQESSILIDANIFPGNSGGPVISKPEIISIDGTKPNNKAMLIGIVKSYIPYQDIAISQQTGRTRLILEENSGLALVETVDNIRITVNQWYAEHYKQDLSNSNNDVIQ